MKFLNTVDLQSNELQNAVIHNYAGNPDTVLSGTEGQIVYSTTVDALFVNTNGATAWAQLSSAAGTVTSVTAGNAITVTGTSTVPIVNHADTSSVADLTATARTYVTGMTFDTYGHVQTISTATETVTNSDTTYSISVEAGAANTSIIRLTDSGAGTDDITISGGTAVTVTEVGDVITIASSDTIDYVNAATFASGTGVLTLSGVGSAGATVNLDGRYLTAETDTLDDVTGRGASTANAITVGGLTVNGDLTVSGAHTVTVAETLAIEDALFVLNSNEAGVPSQDAGFVIERGSSTNQMFVWDESADEFIFASTTETGTTAGNAVVSDYAPIHVGGFTADDAASIGGTLTLSTVVNAGADTDKFLVLDATGNVDFRTGAEVRSDIGAGTGNGTFDDFTIAADSGTANTITDGETFTIIGGGDVSTVVSANQISVNFTESYTAHENITAATSADNSGNTFIQDVTVDGNGHVTGLVSTAVSGLDNYQSWTISDGTNTEAIGSADTLVVSGGGDVTTTYTAASNTLEVSFTETYTAHENITAATSVNGSGIDFVQDVTVDGNGHVTGLANATIRTATASLEGVVELATDAEASTGSSSSLAVTPSGVEQFRADREAVFTISGDGVATSFALTHSFGTQIVMVEVVDFGNNGTGATYETVYADVTRNTVNQVTVAFGAAPSATQDYKVMLRVIA